MSDYTAVLLIVLLPLAWVVVFVIRALMGGRFKTRDNLAKEGALLTGQWEKKQQGALHRAEEDNEVLHYQEQLDKEMQSDEHVYPVHTTQAEHLKKEYHVGEEKEAHFPERKK